MPNNAQLRARTVLLVVVTLCLLALLYAICTLTLVALGRPVPGEVWMASGGAMGYVAALLINTKQDKEVQAIEGMPGGEPVPTVADKEK